ncbi:methylthioribulose 1-phosphate dehydratase [Acidithiobacillus sp. CV18-2]|uniref:Methylthioribulose-1-phosphate dehydratase n=1 Tax=Igneacidithiobacillus copahuensis TaxID=2724909 RepID=A0AAE2YMP0_9PROT|nr:methylthioribulose 1-phosphate dehydratase [Igneacidithiobacillus copahuensis]MBU2753916.1 methylthioribulose 1-phosphate dehydratase [Acidithiobacillus sp. CV18-3]MBU2756144.1 methylthioribulose 1-phosphate dehydratase [Acidithiobacillus sp. BN09-2]MBU2778589.1 methylthioribulose 1-phosphate dehydratase [Acidithiobacillus sp. CV18-2]MBU2797156.1 methylthioribulose 1-phosphate dehydratase [Acidithiobacillus sp. VAN18-2]MBU2798955.1 methylthioribulose 1-phosphate dehydratase [Acidithiobacill
MTDPRAKLAAAARDFYQRGWMLGTAGNLSARRTADSFWITASGRPKDALSEEDFVAVDLAGRVQEATAGRRPSAETSIHQVIYRHFPEAQVIFHVHSVEANLCGHFAKAGQLRLPPLEMLKGLGIPEAEPAVDLPVFANHVEVAQIAADMDAAFLQRLPRVPGALIHEHGMTAWGRDFDAARHHLELFEYCFRYLSLARLHGLGGES